jgi:hypothetical protein
MTVKNNYIWTLWEKAQNFLFAEGHSERLGFMRFLLCGALFYNAIFRQLNIDQFTDLSLLPRNAALSVYPEFYRPYFQYFFWPDSMASSIHLVLIGLLFFGMLGLINRPLLFLTWVISQGFINRNYSMLFGADLIGALFLFYLSFTNCTDYFSLKNRFFKPAQGHSATYFPDQLSTVFFRLMQIQICVIYMYTGFEKLKGNTWWDGTALWTVFANPQFSAFNLIWLKNFPLFFVVGTFVTVVFEIYFPAMVMNKKTRSYWLWTGVFFHLAIGITLGLMTFALIMISTYFLFIDRLTLRQWSSGHFINFKK